MKERCNFALNDRAGKKSSFPYIINEDPITSAIKAN